MSIVEIAVAVLVLAGLETWRRSLRGCMPRWMHVVTILLLVEIVVGVIVGQYQLHRALHAMESTDAGQKATMLAREVSSAMNHHAIALAGVVLAVIVLTIGSIVARKRTDPVPVATLRG